MLNKLWAAMFLIGIVVASFYGNLEPVCSGIVDSAKEAMELLFSMAGVICMWNGILYIAKNSGLMESLSKKMQPILKFLFPKLPVEHEASAYISTNFIANVLGLSWACTPIGLQAMKALQKRNVEMGNDPNVASDEMCMFLIINISSLQIIPINMIAYRSQYGSANPLSVVGPSLVATTITTIAAVLLSKCIIAGCERRNCL